MTPTTAPGPAGAPIATALTPAKWAAQRRAGLSTRPVGPRPGPPARVPQRAALTPVIEVLGETLGDRLRGALRGLPIDADAALVRDRLTAAGLHLPETIVARWRADLAAQRAQDTAAPETAS